MAYRPLGWVKYHERYPSLSVNEYIPNSIQTPLTMEQAFEAGADAMLKALLHRGCYIEKGEEFSLERKDHVDHISGPGWLVLIPDEEERP